MDSVVLVTVDSLRPDHVGYRGYERETTPYLDSLADRGSTFSNAYAHAGLTRYSFPSILASVTPLMYGGPDRVVDSQTLVSEGFAAAGYRTGGFHSNLYLSADYGYDRGFDVFFDSAEDPSLATRARTFARKRLAETPVYPLLERAYYLAESTGGVNVGSFHVPADELTDAALEWVGSETVSRPIFLWVHYMDVHHPYLPPAEYQRCFRTDPVGEHEAVRLRRKLLDDPGGVTGAELETVRDLYDAEIRFTDEQVERLVETTRERTDDLTVVVTADHGEHFLERGFFDGASAYDVKLHVPLLVEGWDDTGTYDELVGLCDVPPTLLDAAGIDVPSSYRGESLLVGEPDLDDPGGVTGAELETVRDLYDAEIRFTDEQVERLVETTRERTDDLTVVVTADHGEHFLERGFFDGASAYDVKLHVPLLVEGWDDTGTYDELVGLCDVPPTLLDAAGIDVPSSYRGESLREAVSGGDWARTAVRGGYDDDEPTYLYRERDWKFIERPGNRPDELYDLASDPAEQDDVVSAFPDRAKRLRAALERHREEIKATDADVDPVDIDAAAQRRLRRLGYEE
jgi:arylsulfatase A-like enzyme